MKKDYSVFSDDELIKEYRFGDEDACEELLNRYKNLVKKKAKAMYIAGGDSDDLIQEGMIGLYKAVRDFDSDKNASFSTFASMCINRQLCTAVSSANRKKHNPLNTYISFYMPLDTNDDEDGETTLFDTLISENEANPEEWYIDRESAQDMQKHLLNELSDYEKEVIKAFAAGKGYVEIAAMMGKSPKSIDNALQRIKNKLLNIL